MSLKFLTVPRNKYSKINNEPYQKDMEHRKNSLGSKLKITKKRKREKKQNKKHNIGS